MSQLELTKRERALYKRLRSPEKIQRFLNEEVAYNKEPDGASCKGPRPVIAQGLAHCMEGALFGAAALRMLGHEPLLLDLEAVRDTDHVLAVFREHGHWGAIAKSNYSGLQFREPVYRNVRELAMSYFEHYFNLRGEKTLRGFSTRPVNLKRFDRIGWMTAERDLWEIPEYLCGIAHTSLVDREMERRLSRMDRRLFAAGLLGAQ
jgi:hypothetical protein